MKEIDININQAKLLSYSVDLDEGKPEISANIGLFAGNKQISTFSLTTKTFYQGVHFKVSPDIIEPIISIAKKLEAITIRECRKALMELPEPTDVE